MTRNPRLYWETLRHLRPAQLGHRLAASVRRPPPPAPPADVALRDGWQTREERCRLGGHEAFLEGDFEFWGCRRQLDLERPWEAPDLGRSWEYLVHYFDYAPALAAASGATAAGVRRLIELWIHAHRPGRGVAWEPYPTAIRIVNWLDVLSLLGREGDPAWARRVERSLWQQAAWLHRNVERHLLGTHLIKDAKALLLAGSAFAGGEAAAWRRQGEALLRRELRLQVRAEGSHIEPSLMYHDLALEDVLDLLNFGVQCGRELRQELEDVAGRMLRFAAATAAPDGTCALLGDAAQDAVPPPRDLLAYGERLGIARAAAVEGLCFFEGAGIAVWRDAGQYMIADVGSVGPPHLPGHGHCDSLSFEWWVGRRPIVVDAGVRTYEPGPERDASRGTRAHNTLEIDGREQHEIWASFRVARRAAVRARRQGDAVHAELVPWHDRRLCARRRFEPGVGGLRLEDRVEGAGAHTVTTRLHLHPDCDVRLERDALHVQHGNQVARIELPRRPSFEIVTPERSTSFRCERFGVARPTWELRATHTGALPLQYSVRFAVEAGGP